MVWEVEKGKKIPCNNHRVPWQGRAAKARLWSRIALVKTSCLFVSSQTMLHFLFLNNQQMLTIPNRQVGSIPSSVWWGFLFIGAIFSRRRRPANSFMEPSSKMEPPGHHPLHIQPDLQKNKNQTQTEKCLQKNMTFWTDVGFSECNLIPFPEDVFSCPG